MPTDYGKDLPEGAVEAALAKGACPRCGYSVTDLRSSNLSQDTLARRGQCYRNGEAYMGFKCNEGSRSGTNAG